jgi:hypothetical protein
MEDFRKGQIKDSCKEKGGTAMKRLHFRQGDVLLLHRDTLPREAVPTGNKDRIVLAWGESTGHAHAMSTRSAFEFVAGERRFLRVDDFTHLVHEEHAPIIVSPGIYEIVKQREYMREFISYVDD